MSTTREVYIGKYLRAWMPIVTVTTEDWRICPKCKQELSHRYCPSCGTKTEATERQVDRDMYEIFHEIFGSGDQFMNIVLNNPKSKGYNIILPNSAGQGGGEFLDMLDEGETEFPDSELTGDWKKLMEELDKRDMRYEIHNGVVSFFM